MPLLALSAKARLIVPVGAIDSRCELRSPWRRMRSRSGAGSREKSGKAPRSRASSTDAPYAASRMTSAMRRAVVRAAAPS